MLHLAHWFGLSKTSLDEIKFKNTSLFRWPRDGWHNIPPALTSSHLIGYGGRDVFNIAQTVPQLRALICFPFILFDTEVNRGRAGWFGKLASPGTPSSELLHTGRNEDYVSKHFDRWQELAALCLREQDPAKLTELANEMNFVLVRQTPHLDPPLHAPKSNEEGKHDVRQPSWLRSGNRG